MKLCKNKIIKIACLSTSALLLLTMLAACTSEVKTAATRGKNVKAVEAVKTDMVIHQEYAGKTRPAQEITVSAKVPGRVQLVNADVGTAIQKGDILFTMESDNAKAQLKQSESAVGGAQANLDRTKDSMLSQQVLQAETALSSAQIQYNDAKRMYDNTLALYKEDASSKQQLDDAESRYKSTRLQLDNAKENLALLKKKAGPQSIASASSQLDQAQATYELAAIQLDDTKITAPIQGVIAARNIDAGELVSGGTPAFVLIDPRKILVEITVSDQVIGKLKPGQKVTVDIPALERKTAEGTVETVSPAADARSQGYTVKLSLDNADQAVKPGMLAKVSLPAEIHKNTLTVPNQAVITEDGIQYILVVADQKIKRKKITIGLSDEKMTEVTAGLSEGELVVTEGQSFLNPGDPVNQVK
jgi:HlyD family secretion protein